VGKMGKRGITLLWAFGLLLLPNDRVAGEQEHGNHRPGGSLGRSSSECHATRKHSNRSRVAWLFYIRSRMRNPRKHSAMPRQEIAVASWAHWGLAMTEYHQMWEPNPGPQNCNAALPKSKERAN